MPSFRSKSLFILLSLHLGVLSQASLFQSAYEPATAFYKNPESLFVSGYASKNDLLAQTRQSYTEFNFEASIGNRTLNVQNEQILREINVALKVKVKKASPLYETADLSSASIMLLKEDQTLEIESLQGAFARVHHRSKKSGYILTSSLEVIDEDSGAWVNIQALSLKAAAKSSAKQKVLIPALTRLQLIKFENDYGLFRTGFYEGYARLTDVVGRVDFAELAWDQKKRTWERVLYRNGAELVVLPTRKVPLENFKAFKGTKNRALISGDHTSLAKGTRIELVKPQAVRWTQSEIKGHGSVWWRRDLLSETLNLESITTAELLKKNLAGISYDSKTKKGLASAGGIYRTVDGKNWKKISSFLNEDWPVLIHPTGVWFVGTFRSTDEGKTFQPSLKYSDLARILQDSGNRNRAFIHLKVLDLETLPNSQMIMKVDTGVTIAKLKSHVLSNNWVLQP